MKRTLLLLIAAFAPLPAMAVDPLVVYSARKEELIKPLMDQFTKETGIPITVLSDESPKLIARLKAEGKQSPADVLLTADVVNAQLAADDGLLKPIHSKALEAMIPKAFRDDQGRWFGLSKRARIIFFNKDKVNPTELSTYEDLADPKWKGRLLMRSSSNVYSQSLIASLIAKNGEAKAEAWAKGIAANIAKTASGGDTDLLKQVAKGEADVTLANTYYYARLLTSQLPEERALAEKIGYVFPKNTHVNLSTGALTAFTKREADAMALLEFLGSKTGQEFYASSNHEYPIDASVSTPKTLQSMGAFTADATPMTTIAKHAKSAIILADKAGWK